MSNVQKALKSIELAEETGNLQYLVDALNQCKSALSEIEKCEPYIEIRTGLFAHIKWLRVNDLPDGTLLYTSPQPRDWVGLSKEHKMQCIAECGSVSEYQFKVIESKLKQLNTKG